MNKNANGKFKWPSHIMLKEEYLLSNYTRICCFQNSNRLTKLCISFLKVASTRYNNLSFTLNRIPRDQHTTRLLRPSLMSWLINLCRFTFHPLAQMCLTRQSRVLVLYTYQFQFVWCHIVSLYRTRVTFYRIWKWIRILYNVLWARQRASNLAYLGPCL